MSDEPLASTTTPAPGRRALLQDHPRLRRELIIFGSCLLLGLIAMPLLIYLTGTYTLGAYADGHLGSFLGNVYQGLAHGWPAAWGVVLGPYVLLTMLRGAVRLRSWLKSLATA